MLPEETELARLEAEQAELQERVTNAELTLETVKTETARFQQKYYEIVGRLYSQLDEICALIADLKLKQLPDDVSLKTYAQAARQQARQSAEEAGLIESQPRLPPEISLNLKQTYRAAVKLIHPDLAISERERQRRTRLMALVNLAYERGDQKAIEKLIEEFGEDPEAIVGDDVGSRIVKAIRRVAQLRRRLRELEQEMEAYQTTEIFILRGTIEAAEARGEDPLGELARQLLQEISQRELKMKAMRNAAA